MIKFYTRVGNKVYDRHGDFIHFPAGEFQIKDDFNTRISIEIAVITDCVDADDYIKLAMWSDAVKHDGGTAIAVIPYLPAARADKETFPGIKYYADMINNANLDRIYCFDPHSTRYKDFYDAEKIQVVNSTYAFGFENSPDLSRYDGIIAPDEGSHNRARAVAALNEFGELPVFFSYKYRDQETGKILRIDPLEIPAGHYLVVDDICDGGGTFVGLVEATNDPNLKYDLFVSHGIFSKPMSKLFYYFDNIYCTNSFHVQKSQINVIDVITPMLKEVHV